MAQLLVLHGPNLNLLGHREPAIYGGRSLAEIDAELSAAAAEAGYGLECFQSNAEHALIERVHQAGEQGVAFLLVNPGGYTHTSVALRDALAAVGIPFIEVHISNIYAREPFRRRSYFSDIATGIVSGLGPAGYRLALQGALEWLGTHAAQPPSRSQGPTRAR